MSKAFSSLLGAIGGGFLGILAWHGVALATGSRVGMMAWAVGCTVGLGTTFLGGNGRRAGVVGAGITLAWILVARPAPGEAPLAIAETRDLGDQQGPPGSAFVEYSSAPTPANGPKVSSLENEHSGSGPRCTSVMVVLSLIDRGLALVEWAFVFLGVATAYFLCEAEKAKTRAVPRTRGPHEGAGCPEAGKRVQVGGAT